MVEQDMLTVIFNSNQPFDPVLTVARRTGGITVLNRFTGDEAVELYCKLVRKEKTDDGH